MSPTEERNLSMSLPLVPATSFFTSLSRKAGFVTSTSSSAILALSAALPFACTRSSLLRASSASTFSPVARDMSIILLI